MNKAKRIISVLAISLSTLMLCSCGSKVYASSKAISVAEQAIEITDQYLDGDVDYDEISDKLDELHDEMDYVSDMPTDTSDEVKQHSADASISSDLVILSSKVLSDHFNGTNETYDAIVEKRNDIAETAGLDKR